jgi:hypothetical protein
MRLSKIKTPVARNLSTGEAREMRVDPHLYTSVIDWKPIPVEQYVTLLHDYQTLDQAIDDYGGGVMSTKAFAMGGDTTVVITYLPKAEGSPVSSPVLMTIRNEKTLKAICFASLRYGIVVDGLSA